jgi:hypothetical protein
MEKKIERIWKILTLWFKMAIMGEKEINGYLFKKVGNSPIVGVHHYDGYEIINQKTNKVLYRKVKDWGIIGDRSGDYNPSRYNTVSKFFPKNI